MKIEILNPIEHNGKRFERGVVEIAEELAKIFLKFKHAAKAAIGAVEETTSTATEAALGQPTPPASKQ